LNVSLLLEVQRLGNLTALVTVTKVVAAPVQATTAAELAATVAEATSTTAEEDEAVSADPVSDELELDPDAETVDFVPSTATAVKLAKPLLAMTCATLKPSAAKGVIFDLFELAFSRDESRTAGSMRGTTPRRATVVGRVGSEQMDGMDVTKGLKFCSAATRPRAAAMAASLVPRVATMWSAWVSSGWVRDTTQRGIR